MAPAAPPVAREARDPALVAMPVGAAVLVLAGITGHVVAVAVLVATVPVGAAVWARPQRGLLLLAALLPFDGLLLLAEVPDAVLGWKEGLLVLTAVAAAVPGRHRRPLTAPLPGWLAPMALLVTLSLLSAYGLGMLRLVVGMKVAFFAMGAGLVALRCPFTARDRDRLVTLLAVTGAVVAAYGVVQQVLGPERLNELGYPYNSVIRFTGDRMRSWSTFNQPFPFAFHLMLVTLVTGAVALDDPRRPRNTAILAAVPLFLVGMAAAVVRSSWIGTTAGLGYLALTRHRRLVAATPALAAVVSVALLAGAAGFFATQSVEERQERWTAVLPVVADAPLGQGIGTSGAAAARTEALAGGAATYDTDAVGGGTLVFQPDNTYMKVLYEVGPFGLVAFVGLLGAAFAAARPSGRARADAALAAGVAAFVAAAAVAGLASTFFEIYPLDYFFWLLVGVVSVPIVGPGLKPADETAD